MSEDLDRDGSTTYLRNRLVVTDGIDITVRDGRQIRDRAGQAAVFSSQVLNIVKLTQAAYDALTPPDPTTLYVVVG